MTTQASSITKCRERTEGVIATKRLIEELSEVEPISNLKPHAATNEAIINLIDEADKAQNYTIGQLRVILLHFERAQDATYREAVRLADFPAEGENGPAALAALNTWLAERGFVLGS